MDLMTASCQTLATNDYDNKASPEAPVTNWIIGPNYYRLFRIKRPD